MAAGDEQDLTEAVVTCEGNLHDPDFQDRFRTLVDNLKSTLHISKTKDPFRVRKIEPWNSVRVTISIPKEAAQKLKLLAQQGSNVLRSMGILSVQVEGDQVISLTWAAQNNEATQVILRQTSDDSATSSGTSGVSSSSLPASSPSISSISSSVASISSPIPLTPGSSGEGSSGMSVTLDMLSSSASPSVAFRSPNVVAPSGESIPVLPPKTPAAGTRPAFGGPFPFVSMAHAAQAIQRSELSPMLNSNNIVVSNSITSGSNAANSTNSVASLAPSTSSSLQGASKNVQPPPGPPPLGNIPLTASNNTESSTGPSINDVSTSSTCNVVSTVNVSSESQVTRLIIENTPGFSSATQAVGNNVASLGFSGNSNSNNNLARSQAGPSQSLQQLQLVNVPPPYHGVNTSSFNKNTISPSPSSSNSNVQSRNHQQQASLVSRNVDPSTTCSSSNTLLPAITTAGHVPSSQGHLRKGGGFVSEVPSVAPLSTSNLSDNTSGVLLAQPVSSPLLVNLLQNNDASPGSSNVDSHNNQQQLLQTNASSQPQTTAEQPARHLLQQQQPKKTKRGVSLDGASSVPKTIPKIESSSGLTAPTLTTQQGSSTEPVQNPMPSVSNPNSSLSRVSIPVAPPNKVASPLPNKAASEQSSTSLLHGRTIVQGNIRILDQGSGQIRTIPVQQPPPPPYPGVASSLPGKTNVTAGPNASRSNESEAVTTLANGPTSHAPPYSEISSDGKSQNKATVTLVQPVEQRASAVEQDASRTTTSASSAADQSRTLLPITTVNIVSKSSIKPSSNVSSNNNKDSDSTTFIPPPDPRLSSQMNKLSHSSHSNSAKNSSNLVVQTTSYYSDAKSSTSQSAGRTALPNKRSAKERIFAGGPIPTSGKPRQFLINPLTGHLEPMPNESSSESEEGDDGSGEGGDGRKHTSQKSALQKHKANRGPIIPTGVHHRPLVTTEAGVTVARVIKAPVGDQSLAQSSLPDLDAKKGSSGDVSPSSYLAYGSSVISVSKKPREDPNTNAALQIQKDSKDNNPSPATLTATSVTGEKIKLRLKLGKTEQISPAYKVDVSFVKKSEKTSVLPSSSTTTSSGFGSTSSATSGSSSGNQSSSGEQPKVPPLHISLRGKNAAVVVSPRREEKDMPPPLSIAGVTKDLALGKDSGTSVVENSSLSLSVHSKSSLHLNSHEGKSKTGGSTKRTKSRVKSSDGKSTSVADKTSNKPEKIKVSRPKLNKEVSSTESKSASSLNQVDDGRETVHFTMPVLQPAVQLKEEHIGSGKKNKQDPIPIVPKPSEESLDRIAPAILVKEESIVIPNEDLASSISQQSSSLPNSSPLSGRDLSAEDKTQATGENQAKSDASSEHVSVASSPKNHDPDPANVVISPPKESILVSTEVAKDSIQCTAEMDQFPQLDEVFKGAFSSVESSTTSDKPVEFDGSQPAQLIPEAKCVSEDVGLESLPSPKPPPPPMPDPPSSGESESFVSPVINLSTESCDIKTGPEESHAMSLVKQENTGSENKATFCPEDATVCAQETVNNESSSGATPLKTEDISVHLTCDENKDLAFIAGEEEEKTKNISDTPATEVKAEKVDDEDDKVLDDKSNPTSGEQPNVVLENKTIASSPIEEMETSLAESNVESNSEESVVDTGLLTDTGPQPDVPVTVPHATMETSLPSPSSSLNEIPLSKTEEPKQEEGNVQGSTGADVLEKVSTSVKGDEEEEIKTESASDIPNLEISVADTDMEASNTNTDRSEKVPEDTSAEVEKESKDSEVIGVPEAVSSNEGAVDIIASKSTPIIDTSDVKVNEDSKAEVADKSNVCVSSLPAETTTTLQTTDNDEKVDGDKSDANVSALDSDIPEDSKIEPVDQVVEEKVENVVGESHEAPNAEKIPSTSQPEEPCQVVGVSVAETQKLVESPCNPSIESKPAELVEREDDDGKPVKEIERSLSEESESLNSAVDETTKDAEKIKELTSPLVLDKLVNETQPPSSAVSEAEPSTSTVLKVDEGEKDLEKRLETGSVTELETSTKKAESDEVVKEGNPTPAPEKEILIDEKVHIEDEVKQDCPVADSAKNSEDALPVEVEMESMKPEIAVQNTVKIEQQAIVKPITSSPPPTASPLVPAKVAKTVPKPGDQASQGKLNPSAKVSSSVESVPISNKVSAPVIMTPKLVDPPAAPTASIPPISIVLPSNATDKSGTPKNAYKRRAEIKPGALQNTLKRLHDNLPKVLKTAENQDPSTQSSAVIAASEKNEAVAERAPPPAVKNTQLVGSSVSKPIVSYQGAALAAVANTHTPHTSVAITQVRSVPNIMQRSKASTVTASSTPTQAQIIASTIHQLTSGLQSNVLTNVSAGIPSATMPSVASLSVPSSTSGGPPQTVFAIHPNFAQLQQSNMVLPGGHKKVAIKLVTLPKQSGGQLQTIPLGGATPNRSSPNLLEAVNIVANAGSRSSSPKTTLIGNTMQSTPLNLSSVSLPVGGNLHFVPISVSSGAGTTSNVKVVMAHPIKMQQAGLSQSMVVKSVLMGGHNQPTTIRVIRPANLQEPIAFQTLMKQSEKSAVNDVPKQKVDLTLTEPPIVKAETFTIQNDSLFKKLDGVEIVETGSPLNNDELPFEADIIHDEKDLADVLAAEAKNELMENCTSFHLDLKTGTLKNEEKVKTLKVNVVPGTSATIAPTLNHVTPKKFSQATKESVVDQNTSSSKRLTTSTSLSHSLSSATKNARTHLNASPSPSSQDSNGPDIHGEDQEIINSFSRSPGQGKIVQSESEDTKSSSSGTDMLPDHTYGATSATVSINCEPVNHLSEELSIEIPVNDIEIGVMSPSQNPPEEKRCTRSTRSNTRLSPDITAFVSDTPKSSKLSVKGDAASLMKNSPKQSPTGSLKVLSPTPSSLTITPSTSTRSSPILHNQHQINASNAAATINAVALGIIDKIQGNANAHQSLKNSRVTKLSGGNKRKRQESDSSSASRDENMEEKSEVDLNSRPNKRKCSENAAEMIKVCIGVEDSPKRTASTIKKSEEAKREGKGKKAMATIVDDEDDADSEVSLTRGRSGRSSRESSEDRSSSRGSSAQRAVTTVDKSKLTKEEEPAKETKSGRLNSRAGKEVASKSKLTTGTASPQVQGATINKKTKPAGKTPVRRPNRPNSKEKSPLTPAKTRTNVRKDVTSSQASSEKNATAVTSAVATPDNENARRKTRSSAAGKRHAT